MSTKLVRETTELLIGMAYDSGYLAALAEGGTEINADQQRQVIEKRFELKIALFGLIDSMIDEAKRYTPMEAFFAHTKTQP